MLVLGAYVHELWLSITFYLHWNYGIAFGLIVLNYLDSSVFSSNFDASITNTSHILWVRTINCDDAYAQIFGCCFFLFVQHNHLVLHRRRQWCCSETEANVVLVYASILLYAQQKWQATYKKRECVVQWWQSIVIVFHSMQSQM